MFACLFVWSGHSASDSIVAEAPVEWHKIATRIRFEATIPAFTAILYSIITYCGRS